MWAQLLQGLGGVDQGAPGAFGFGNNWSDVMNSMGPSDMPQGIPWAALASALPDALGSPPTGPNQKIDELSFGDQTRPAAQIPSIQGQPAQQGGFWERMKAIAQGIYPDNPVMQQVAIAQAGLESGGGKSGLAQQNNLFGIKANNMAPGSGPAAMLPTKEYSNNVSQTQVQPFATNSSPEESFMQHRNLLTKAKRYAPVVSAQDPVQAFAALQKAGYATDPNYAQKLAAVWRSNVLPLYGQGGY